MKQLLNIKKYKTYLIYASSIFFGKGLEYVSILVVAYLLTKSQYGEFEFYKKTIELFSVFVAFGTPGLILTYTKSKGSKVNFYIISVALAFIFGGLSLLFLSFFKYAILVIPVVYYATFHYSNSIIQSYNLVQKGSVFASKYKYLFSSIFNGLLLLLVCFIDEKEKSIIYVSYPLIVVGVGYFLYDLKKEYDKGSFEYFRRYFRLFKKQIFNSFTLVLSAICNTAFLVTDIYVLKYFSEEVVRNQIIADYSMVLNITNILLLVPLTLTNVDIELYKKGFVKFEISVKKNIKLSIYITVVLSVFYVLLINTFLVEYKNTLLLFFVILFAKYFQSCTIPYGVFLATRRLYLYNLYVNVVVLALNIILSIFLLDKFGVMGVGYASVISLVVRFVLVKFKYNKMKKG